MHTMTAISSLYLRVFMIPERLMTSVYCYQTSGNSYMVQQNYIGFYIKSMLTAETNLSRVLNVNVMN
jgi:hypothetical protein